MTNKFVESDNSVAGVNVFSTDNDVELISLNAWAVDNIWISPPEVLATPRKDGRIIN